MRICKLSACFIHFVRRCVHWRMMPDLHSSTHDYRPAHTHTHTYKQPICRSKFNDIQSSPCTHILYYTYGRMYVFYVFVCVVCVYVSCVCLWMFALAVIILRLSFYFVYEVSRHIRRCVRWLAQLRPHQ